MDLKSASRNVLDQLALVIEQINPGDYKNGLDTLGASIGQHVRHILEFYLRLLKGSKTGVVNYDLRDRDLRIENDIQFALLTIQEIVDNIELIDSMDLRLELKYGNNDESNIVIDTNFNRELAYNIEHAIHHMAIIKNALKEFYGYVELPESFGIASSTIRYNKGE